MNKISPRPRRVISGALMVIAALAAVSVVTRSQAQNFTPKDLVGTWASAGCEPLGGPQPTFMKRTFNFTEASWSLKLELFVDPACRAPLLTTQLSGPFTLGEAGAPAGARKVTWGQTRKLITPFMPPIVATMDGAKCGEGKNAPGTPQDVSATGCLPLGVPSVKDYGQEFDLLALKDGKLYTGLRRDAMNLEANRPTQLFDFPLVRK
ncbi:MAG: hypothetical protein SFU83_12690 [Meiothermus sp.]|nr:hypothetical protein [Meiothermus sp.]